MNTIKHFAVGAVVLLVMSVFSIGLGSGNADLSEDLDPLSLEDDPEIIEDWSDLYVIRYDLGDHYVLDQTLSEDTHDYDEYASEEAHDGDGWEPIDDFEGSLHGDGHEIRDLYIDREDEDNVGIFRSIEEGGEIDDLRIKDAEVKGGNDVGTLAGENEGVIKDSQVESEVNGENVVGALFGENHGTIDNCLVKGNVSGYENIGGIAGLNHEYLTGSRTEVDIYGEKYVGGLVGSNDGEIKDSHSIGMVEGNEEVGGLLGQNEMEVKRSYAEASVEGDSRIGGLVGRNLGSTVMDSYSEGAVSGNEEVGGLVGTNRYHDEGSNVIDSYATGDVIGDERIGGLVGLNEVDNLVLTSHASGDVDGKIAGGLIGENMGVVENSYALGDVSGEEKATYTLEIEVEIEGEGTVEVDGEEYDESFSYDEEHTEGETVYLKPRPVESYEFREWTGDVSEEVPLLGFTVDENKQKNVQVHFQHIEEPTAHDLYLVGQIEGEGTVEIDGDEYSDIIDYSGTHEEGDIVYLNADPAEGFEFFEWYGDITSEKSVAYMIVDGTKEREVGAIFEEKYETVEKIGGLIGENEGSIESSYSAGGVIGEDKVGGLIGQNEGTVDNSFWDIETSGIDESDGGIGKETENMKDVATFTDLATIGLEEPWDFFGNPNHDESDEMIWDIDEDINEGYPFLAWIEYETYELKIDVDGSGMVIIDGEEIQEYPHSEEFLSGMVIQLEAHPYDEFYFFDNWTGDHEGEQKIINITLDENKEIKANFGEIYYLEMEGYIEGKGMVEVDGHEYTGYIEHTDEVERGKEIDLVAQPAEGYKFVEWRGDITSEKREITMTMDENKYKYIEVFFQPVSFSLEISSSGGGEVVEPGEGMFGYGEDDFPVHLHAEAEEDHHFVEWTGDIQYISDTASEETTFELPDEEDTYQISAEFQEVSDDHELEIEVIGEGHVSPNEGTHAFEEGREVRVVAITSSPWEFSHWMGDLPEDKRGEQEFTIEMDRDRSLRVYFEKVNEEVKYELDLDIEGEGEIVIPDKEETIFYEGEQVLLVASPADEEQFSHWEGDVPEEMKEKEEITIMINDDLEVTAVFEEDEEDEDDDYVGEYWWILILIGLGITAGLIVFFLGSGKEPPTENWQSSKRPKLQKRDTSSEKQHSDDDQMSEREKRDQSTSQELDD